MLYQQYRKHLIDWLIDWLEIYRVLYCRTNVTRDYFQFQGTLLIKNAHKRLVGVRRHIDMCSHMWVDLLLQCFLLHANLSKNDIFVITWTKYVHERPNIFFCIKTYFVVYHGNLSISMLNTFFYSFLISLSHLCWKFWH